MYKVDYEQVGEEIGESYLKLAENYGHDRVIVGIGLFIFLFSKTIYCFLC
jgi:hypothetical protein|tara:strand:- start:92 stop:241 length:150 start_codon:yes stop_codon:yes gene_type:complete